MRLDRGEEAIGTLTSFIEMHKIPCGLLQGIGALRDLEIGYFDLKVNRYRRSKIRQSMEVLSLLGNVSYVNRTPFVHAHVNLAGPGSNVRGGHLFKGIVAVTLEIYIQVFNRRLNRKRDEQIGFNFWDL